ncbi:hypothetical protein VNI00_006406 [Paramarasmius palmivorus]|uniref:DUF6699 domain-containing protein n=1 Tax=Paramarasmius palmivorus TaxID=297713 RepID=A0AAW0D5D0_9AGAR
MLDGKQHLVYMTSRSPSTSTQNSRDALESGQQKKKVTWKSEVQVIPAGDAQKTNDLDAAPASNASTSTPHSQTATQYHPSYHSTRRIPPISQEEATVLPQRPYHGHSAANTAVAHTSTPLSLNRHVVFETSTQAVDTLTESTRFHTPRHMPESKPNPISPSISSTSGSSPSTSHFHTQSTPSPQTSASNQDSPQSSIHRLPRQSPSPPQHSPIHVRLDTNTANTRQDTSQPEYVKGSTSVAKGALRTLSTTPASSGVPVSQFHEVDASLRTNSNDLVCWDVRVPPEVALGGMTWKQLAKPAFEPKMVQANLKIDGITGDVILNVRSLGPRKYLAVQDVLAGIYDELHAKVSLEEFRDSISRDSWNRGLVERTSMIRCCEFDPEDLSTDGGSTIRRVDLLQHFSFGGLEVVEGDLRVIVRMKDSNEGD